MVRIESLIHKGKSFLAVLLLKSTQLWKLWSKENKKVYDYLIHNNKLTFDPGVGELCLKRGTGMCGGKKPPFHVPSAPPSPFHHLSVPQDPILSHNISQYCLFLANFKFLILKIGQNSVQEASIWSKYQSWKQYLVKIGAKVHTQTKIEYPWDLTP